MFVSPFGLIKNRLPMTHMSHGFPNTASEFSQQLAGFFMFLDIADTAQKRRVSQRGRGAPLPFELRPLAERWRMSRTENERTPRG
ncbi:hypothetical protein, partial [Novipirellula rosea]|uniref:hypothetical protein n=1 Tax=Novipirellula rosea TaxID=1031540 RepID=UPI0031E556DC